MATTAQRVHVPVERLDVAAYTIPTEEPEADGTLVWDSTTVVVVHVEGGGERGLGYTYAHAAAASAGRCLGITGFLRASALADAHGLDVSAHTAPSLHLHACLAVPRLRHVEWFHDHVRIEGMLFDGFVDPVDGALAPDLSRPGHGIELKAADAERFA